MKTCYYQSKKLDPKKHLVVQTSIGSPRFGTQPEWETEHITPRPKVLALADKGKSVYEPAYRRQLDAIGIDAIRAELNELEADAKKPTANACVEIPGPREVVLCCFCGPKKPFCHRHIFAEWWHEKTGEKIEEL